MKYWIIINGAQLGPMELDELLALNPRPDSPVWYEGLENWVAAETVPEIAVLFSEPVMPEVPDIPDIPEESAPNAMPEVPVEEVIVEETRGASTSRTDRQQADDEARRHYERGYSEGYRRGYDHARNANSASSYGNTRQYQQAPRNDNGPRYYSRNDNAYSFGPNPVCPPTYLWGSILCIIFCCTIPGIVSLVYATQVKSRFKTGDYDGAESASTTAMWWLIISLVLGLMGAPFWLFGIFK